MDATWLLYGAIGGLVTGLLWGRFVTLGERGGMRSRRESITSLALFVGTLFVLDRVMPLMPSAFWVTMFVVAWFVEPMGRRLRERPT